MPPDIRNSIANALPPDSTQFVLIKPGDIKYAYAIDPTNPSGPSRAEILGEGGFATVRKAMWQDKEVAVKLCNLSPTSSNVITTNTIAGGPKQRAQLAQMLLREAQSMHAMKHARVVALLGFVQSNPPSLVMEFMEVGTLKQYIKNNYKTITWSIRLVFMIDVALGMEYLHAKVGPGGEKKAVVFHQDLKTANVLLGHEDGKIRAKISDFGLACKV